MSERERERERDMVIFPDTSVYKKNTIFAPYKGPQTYNVLGYMNTADVKGMVHRKSLVRIRN